MDRPDADAEALRRSLVYIRRINNVLRYTGVSLRQFKKWSRAWRPGETIRILDVATGSADIPRAILAWATKRGLNVKVVGVDLHPQTLRIAAEEGADPRLTLLRADALSLPFADGSFDYVHTAMFLHHLDEADAARVLSEMSRVARRGIVAADILRNGRAYAWITLFTLLASPMVRHDARTSVKGAFTKPEVLRLRDRAGLRYARYARHFGHRFTLAGEK